MKETISRRGFLAGTGAAAVLAGAALSGCGNQAAQSASGDAGQAGKTSGSTPSWLEAEPEIAEKDIAGTESCDVLVIGCGTSGLFAACSAAENGAKVIAVEKGAAGVGIRGTLGGIGTKWQAENGTDIKATDICHDIARYSASSVNGALTRLWATESAETVEWYGDLCVKAGREFVLCSDNDLSDEEQSGFYRHWATGHAAVVDGKTAEDDAILTNYATEQGVDLRYSTEMIKLVKDGDRVSGAIIKDSEGACKQIDAAKGVIVCTGGYAQNPDMLSALQPDTLRIFSFNSGMPNAIGSGIKACIWAGADFDSTHTSMLFDRCPLRPDQIAGEPSDGMFWMGSQPWLKVNLEGNRFADESAPYDFILHASATQPGHTYCTIFDSNYVDYIYQFKTQGCSRMFPFENGAPVSAITLEMAQGMNQGLLESGMMQQADTIEELADKLHIPVDAFAATVKRYNEMVAAGDDRDFGKEAFRLSPVDTPPFYGIRQTGYMLCTMDGIPIDTDMRALDPDGKPIEGLFVGGNDSGSFFSHSYPDLVPGLAAGRSATFGRRAGRIAATA